jgi:hypothetical protein
LQAIPKFPVFVVGSPRSGTSALVDALLGVGYHGYREGNFLQLLTLIDRLIDRHFATYGQSGPQVLASHVDVDGLKASIGALFASIVNDLHPVAPWVDKSGNPEMIEAIPTLLKLWPEGRFIFAKRRGIENIASRMKKFPQHNFEYHCRDWARNMRAWRLQRANISPGSFIEVDQQDMIRKPAAVAGRLAELLGLSQSEQEALTSIFDRGRPQQTIEGSAERVLIPEDMWTDVQMEMFTSLCGTEMREFGYSKDKTYWGPANGE